MRHPVHRVRGFEIVNSYTLRVEFEDGVSRTIDFEPVLAGELFGPLRDLSLFNQVALDREVRTLVWPNGADFDPATLHDWPQMAAEMAAMARRWATTTQETGRRSLVFGAIEVRGIQRMNKLSK